MKQFYFSICRFDIQHNIWRLLLKYLERNWDEDSTAIYIKSIQTFWNFLNMGDWAHSRKSKYFSILSIPI